ncbi:MAG: site-specific integrase [Candidatus Thermoplasmatota archaeon]|nr:site-specific integrase [Candidatus Thermoplasmatota archaeon]
MKMVEEFLQLTEGNLQITPMTQKGTVETLQRWADFLRERKVRRDRVQIEDFKDFEKKLLASGLKTSTISVYEGRVIRYYKFLANAHPHSRWPNFVAQLKTHLRPKVRGSLSPHQPYPLEIIPDICEAAKECALEEYQLVIGLLYTGMRAQMYGILVKEVDFDKEVLTPVIKGGYRVVIPMHRRIAEVWKEHLENRDYESDFVFQNGVYPYTYLDAPEGGGYVEDVRNMRRNRANVLEQLRRVEARLEERGVKERLTAHRFRKSVGTYASEFGLDLTDRRILLAHKAKDITELYDLRDPRKVKAKWDRIDPESREWVENAMSSGSVPPMVSASNGNGDVVATIRALRLELVKTLDSGKRAIIEPLFEGFEKSLTALLNGAA